jgi:hypothetical protein
LYLQLLRGITTAGFYERISILKTCKNHREKKNQPIITGCKGLVFMAI